MPIKSSSWASLYTCNVLSFFKPANFNSSYKLDHCKMTLLKLSLWHCYIVWQERPLLESILYTGSVKIHTRYMYLLHNQHFRVHKKRHSRPTYINKSFQTSKKWICHIKTLIEFCNQNASHPRKLTIVLFIWLQCHLFDKGFNT